MAIKTYKTPSQEAFEKWWEKTYQASISSWVEVAFKEVASNAWENGVDFGRYN